MKRDKAQGVHDKGTQSCIDELLKDSHVLAVASNILYRDKTVIPNVHGELDILAFYRTGQIKYIEVKSNLTQTSLNKAHEQLERMRNVWNRYDTELATYIVNGGVTIPYAPIKK